VYGHESTWEEKGDELFLMLKTPCALWQSMYVHILRCLTNSSNSLFLYLTPLLLWHYKTKRATVTIMVYRPARSDAAFEADFELAPHLFSFDELGAPDVDTSTLLISMGD